MVNAELRVVSGKHTGNVIPLPVGRFLIGREEDCHLRPNSDLVSRHHCVFHADEYTLRLRDLGSTNGTLVNGERLRGEVVLNSGDVVAIGQLEFEIHIGEGESPAVSVPEPGQVIDAADPVNETIVGGSDPTGQETLDNMPVVGDVPAALQDTGAFQNDTVLQPYPGQHPAYAQQPPGYPMGYPQMGYPYGMPMYPQQMPMYPQQMPGYPHQQMPGYPQQQMPVAPQPQPPPQQEAGRTTADVNLPDPSTTGAKPPAPPAGASGDGKSSEVKVTDTAGDIIKQYLQRRPQQK